MSAEFVTVAALYVETGGAYFGLPGVDPWDEARDARLYDGPHPVVAHPPCQKWCQLAPLNASRLDGYYVGDDGGCFAAALRAVRTWGGVLERRPEPAAVSGATLATYITRQTFCVRCHEPLLDRCAHTCGEPAWSPRVSLRALRDANRRKSHRLRNAPP